MVSAIDLPFLTRRAAAWAAALALVLLGGARATAQDRLAFEVRAVYLYNFARFVEWPASSFPNASAPIRICVAGEDPFGPALDRAVADETINGRQLEAVRLGVRDNPRNCHVLYISSSENSRVRQLLVPLKDVPVVTVGEHRDFLSQGGIVRFRMVADRVRFDINVRDAQERGLRISSRLLSVAAGVVKEPRP